MFSPEVRRKIQVNQIERLLGRYMDSEDKLTVVFSGSLKDKCLYQVLGFESGKIVVIPFFIDSGKRDLTFYLGGIGNS